ncbi:MAG: DUF423 domain-containing protein [Sumerlaeia bacterium]
MIIHPREGISGCVLLFLSVALGAFAAHGLEKTLEPRSLQIFRTAVDYQTMHAFGLLYLSVTGKALGSRLRGGIFGLFIAGIILFSGSLYALALMPQYGWLGAITPLGGLCFLAAWAALAVGLFRLKAEP